MIIIVVVTTEARQQSEAYSELLGVNYFCKILRLRCLAVFLIYFWYSYNVCSVNLIHNYAVCVVSVCF